MKRYAWCPVCGAAFDRSPGESRAGSLLHCGACGFDFWLNSKPAVAAVVLRQVGGQTHVLLTRRGIEPHKGMWDFPGGFLNNGEHPEQGLARELAEELDTTLQRAALFRVEIDEYPRDDVAVEGRFVLSLFYRCDLPAGAMLTPADDVAEAAWFPLTALPSEIAFPADRRVLLALQGGAAMPAGDGSPG